MIAGVILWIVFSILLGVIGLKRKIGFLGAFSLSLLLSPLVGLIFVLASKPLDAEKFEQELLQTQKEQQQNIEKVVSQNVDTVAAELKKIKNLLDDKIINEDDYEKMKENIINKYKSSSSEKPNSGELEIDDSDLTASEKDKVQKMLENLKSGEVITKHLGNKKIEIMNMKQYEVWRKTYGEKVVKILVKKPY